MSSKSRRDQALETVEPFLEEWARHTSGTHEAFRNWAVEQILWDDMLSTSEIADVTACDGPKDKGIDGWFVRRDDSEHRTIVILQAKDTQPVPEDVNKLVDGFVSLFDENRNERASANAEIFQMADTVDQLLEDLTVSIELE